MSNKRDTTKRKGQRNSKRAREEERRRNKRSVLEVFIELQLEKQGEKGQI